MMKIDANQIKTHFSMRTILILLLLQFGMPQAFADDDHIITIGGSVYAGGRSGAILEYKVKKDANGNVETDTNGDPIIDKDKNNNPLDGGKGTTNVTIYEGTIGTTENLEIGLGCVFGGGYGPLANVRFSNVIIKGGTILNSVYGGGEIAAIGEGETDAPIDKVPIFKRVTKQGHTNVLIYKGDVGRNVFGGGRGYTLTQMDGFTALGRRTYTDGYVFGSTKVRIYGGTVGDEDAVDNGFGNVFGGGDVGFLYSGNEEKTADENDYLETGKTYYVIPSETWLKASPRSLTDKQYNAFYANPADKSKAGALSLACDVKVEPQARVLEGTTINGHSYAVGDYVSFDDLNTLSGKNDPLWEYLDHETENHKSGIHIRNAVFAGGNVSEGDSHVFSGTTTVTGNVVATLNDLYNQDLITIGTEHVGGLYGDGNLTVVKGYRELNISNYGTDYYQLDARIEYADWEKLTTREKAYFQLEYECTAEGGDGTNPHYDKGARLLQDLYEAQINSGNIDAANWIRAGFCSIYAGRLLNTVQRADFAGMFGSRLVLQGAQDRVVTAEQYLEGTVNFAKVYTINRIGELSMNKQPNPVGGDTDVVGKFHGNYFGIYSGVNYLGGLTSDVRFSDEDKRWIEATNAETGDKYRDVSNKTYYQWKKDNFSSSMLKNAAMSDNVIALASGVALELKVEPENPSVTQDKWGFITGVIQLQLINVTAGEGGGFVYARNEHGTPSRRMIDSTPYERLFLSDDNAHAATHEEYTYTLGSGDDNRKIQTSGNFVQEPSDATNPAERQFIVDDCFPIHWSSSDPNSKLTNHDDQAHYWYVRGTTYTYSQLISAYTGTAAQYSEELSMPLATSGSNVKIQLADVHEGLYCNVEGPVSVGENDYYYNDPISWWEWNKASESDKAKFTTQSAYTVTEDDVVVTKQRNNMSHETGYVLTLEFDQPDFYTPTGDVTYGDPPVAGKGPTFHPATSGVYGQHYYNVGSYITEREYIDYQTNIVTPHYSVSGQATVEPENDFYLCTQSLQLSTGGELLMSKGDLIAKSDIGDLEHPGDLVKRYIAIWKETQVENVDPYLTNDNINAAITALNNCCTVCYQVTTAGNYGGKWYDATTHYNALEGWCSLSDDDRTDAKWPFDNNALDLLNVLNSYKTEKLINPALTQSPTEKTTLYVSRYSNMSDLPKEKNYTVHFIYSYEEPQEGGSGTVDYVENHYINITIKFLDELPYVGAIKQPDTVLPGTIINFKEPEVIAGALGIAGGGWEMYRTQSDAQKHVNGIPYENRSEPFYWYQDSYWVDYYAATLVGGKKFSSEGAVQIHVANSHDLKNVVDDPNHLMIDKAGARNAKIYINDYTDKSESGVDLLKQFFNLTYSDAKLSSSVPGCQDLEIILRSDQAPNDAWDSPIGSNSQCFEGNLHGDGYTISGLDASLFNKLCGHVYNLGVTGSFTSSGIAETNSGSIENCWVLTTGSPANSTKPIANGGTIVNCYFNKKYSSTNDGAIKKDDRFFYNGNVAYELNGFHLSNKGKESEGDLTGLTDNYVENRYVDGDFRYADGYATYTNGIIPYIPDDEDARWNTTKFWPLSDDYIFFGQRLTYGYRQNLVHEDKPSRISDDMVNRVYRAPAYFQSAEVGKAYYNKDAVFAAKSADGVHTVYPGMTAIDFTGNDSGSTILDHDGLTDFINADLTQNLLVYANYVADEDENTEDDDDLLTRLLDSREPAYADHAKSAVTSGTDAEITGANSVSVVSDDKITPIKGHVVFKKSNAYETNSDHFLVDRQDFFAPISYQMASGKRMWYQRQPDNYAEKVEKTENQNTIYKSIGWESLSLPFTAELVTTQKKGEITHFYAGETKGHEYWLRGYLGTGQANAVDANIFEANFQYPAAGSSAKTVANTFLWDYYYSKESRQDEHSDQYQPGSTQDDYHYYKNSRSYTTYPRLAANTPYIVGFPGETYYEFDLSGQFEAMHAKVKPAEFGAQTITFATAENATITQTSNTAVTGAGYSFVPCFVAKDKRELSSKVYLLNALETQNHDPAGSIFEQVSDGDYTVPFRAYFTAPLDNPNPTRGIIFVNGDNSEMSTFLDPVQRQESGAEEGLVIRPGERSIIVKSNLNEPASVRIVNLSGITLRTFTINPGETIVTPVHLAGIYIVNHKKVAVK